MDSIFSKKPKEWYHGQEVSTAHDSIKEFKLPQYYVLFAYPRDFTPVCTQELKELQKHLDDFSIQVMACSTDSPESHNVFFNDEEAFPPEEVPNIEYPILTISEHELTGLGMSLLLNDYGYCNRIALIIKEAELVGQYKVPNDEQRDVEFLVKLASKAR